MWEKSIVIGKPLFFLCSVMSHGAELCEHISDSAVLWQRATGPTSGFSTPVMITPTPWRSGASLLHQSKGSFTSPFMQTTKSVLQRSNQSDWCASLGRWKGQGSFFCCYLERMKCPEINVWTRWLAWEQQQCSKDVVAQLPFPRWALQWATSGGTPTPPTPSAPIPGATLHLSSLVFDPLIIRDVEVQPERCSSKRNQVFLRVQQISSRSAVEWSQRAKWSPGGGGGLFFFSSSTFKYYQVSIETWSLERIWSRSLWCCELTHLQGKVSAPMRSEFIVI